MATSTVSRVGPYIVSGRVLGTGTTSTVKMAFHQDTGHEVALKIIGKASLFRHPDKIRVVQREIAVMKLLSHPNVLELIDVYESEDSLFLVQEYVPGGELFGLLYEKGAPPPDLALKFFHDLLEGLYYCHSHLICHRDLKPENLLLTADGSGLKIADFGMARLMNMDALRTSCGSPHYAAPEIVRGDAYDGRKTDAWSCGVILFALFSGKLPFDDPDIKVLLGLIKLNQYVMPPYIPRNVQDLIRKLLVIDPVERYSIDQCRRHPIMSAFYSSPPRVYPPLAEQYAATRRRKTAATAAVRKKSKRSDSDSDSDSDSVFPNIDGDDDDNNNNNNNGRRKKRHSSDWDTKESDDDDDDDDDDDNKESDDNDCPPDGWDGDVVSTLSSLGCGAVREVELCLDLNTSPVVKALYHLLVERKQAATSDQPPARAAQPRRRPTHKKTKPMPLDLHVDLGVLKEKDRLALDSLVSPHAPSPIALMAQRKAAAAAVASPSTTAATTSAKTTPSSSRRRAGTSTGKQPIDMAAARHVPASPRARSPPSPSPTSSLSVSSGGAPVLASASASSMMSSSLPSSGPSAFSPPRLPISPRTSRSPSPSASGDGDGSDVQLTPRRRSAFRLFTPPRLTKSSKQSSTSNMQPQAADGPTSPERETSSPSDASSGSDSEEPAVGLNNFSTPSTPPSPHRLRSSSFGISMKMFWTPRVTRTKPWESAAPMQPVGLSASATCSTSHQPPAQSSSSSPRAPSPSSASPTKPPSAQIKKASWFPSFLKPK